MPKHKETETTAEPKKKRSPALDVGKNDAHAKVSGAATSKIEKETRKSKAVVLKLPSALKKAARACANDQGLKLRAWIVELIKVQIAKESANPTAKPLKKA